jgi:tetratricopeptide (TPR) repeat protein
MRTMRVGAKAARSVLTLLGLLVLAGTAHAADEDLRKKALRLNEITGLAPMRGQLEALIEDPAGTKKLLAVAARMVKEKPQPFNRNAAYLLALAAANQKEVDLSATFYRVCAGQALKLLSERGLAQAYGGLIQLYFENNKFAESEKVCKEVLDLDGDEATEGIKPVVMRRLILAVARQGAYDRALKLVEERLGADPDNWLTLALKGEVLRLAGKLEASAKVYLAVLAAVKKDKALEAEEREEFLSDYRYLLSNVYVDLNQIDKAAEQLKELLAQQPNNPTYNNDLGYIWADHGLHLAEAEKLIRKALEEDRKQRRKDHPELKPELDRDNAAYLDSLGWVLFKQGKAKEAKPYLLQAVKEKEGQHIEIYDHLGDVHKALGEKAEAIAAWKKALEHTTPSKRDQKRKAEVLKKLEAKE